MPAQDNPLIRVQSEWNGWRHAEVHLRDLQNVHWFQPGPAPRPLLHGYIDLQTWWLAIFPTTAIGPRRRIGCSSACSRSTPCRRHSRNSFDAQTTCLQRRVRLSG